MLILACFKTLTRFVILLSLCTAHAIWAILFLQGVGGGQIYTKQNPTQEKPRKKARHEKIII